MVHNGTMPSHPDVHLGVQSPRSGKLVRLEFVKIDAVDHSTVIKIIPCDSNGRTRPDEHPSPELVKLTSEPDVRAYTSLPRGQNVCWLRCHRETKTG